MNCRTINKKHNNTAQHDSRFSIKPQKRDSAAKWLYNIGTVKNYPFSGAQRVCHEHFEESCFEAELQTRLGFRKFKRLTPGAVPTIFNFNPTESHVQQEIKVYLISVGSTAGSVIKRPIRFT